MNGTEYRIQCRYTPRNKYDVYGEWQFDSREATVFDRIGLARAHCEYLNKNARTKEYRVVGRPSWAGWSPL